MPNLDLVGIAEIAELLGLSRQRVHMIVRTRENFPPPAAALTAGMIWERDAVVEWAVSEGRLPVYKHTQHDSSHP